MSKKILLTILFICIFLSSPIGSSFAQCKSDLGVYNLKLDLIDKKIANSPDNLFNYLNKADLYIEFGQFSLAKPFYEKAEQLNKNIIPDLYLKGMILFCDGQYDESLKTADLLLKDQPNYAKGYYLKGLLNLVKQNPDEGITSFEQALSYDNNMIEAMNKIGWLYNDKSEYGKALLYFNQALLRNNDYVNAIDGKGYALYKLGLSKEATSYINRVIILLPDNWAAWLTKAEIAFSSDNMLLAKYYLFKAESINPDAEAVKLFKQKLHESCLYKKNAQASEKVKDNNEKNNDPAPKKEQVDN